MRNNRMSVMRSVNGTIGSTLRASAALLAVLCLVAAGGAKTGSSVLEQDRPRKFPPMVFDKKIGHFKDMSYEALSDEGLSWEQRTRLFGGDVWAWTTAKGAFPKRVIAIVAADPTKSATGAKWWILGADGLYRSDDSGVTLRKIAVSSHWR